MFFAGLEIDLVQFNRTRNRSIGFGLLTFALPLAAGMLVAFGAGYPLVGALLIGSLLASHTLIAYPIVEKLGKYRELGLTYAIVNFHESAYDTSGVELFEREVIPALR